MQWKFRHVDTIFKYDRSLTKIKLLEKISVWTNNQVDGKYLIRAS